MARRVSWSRDNHNTTVTKHIVISIENHRLAVLEGAESGCRVAWVLRRRVRKHGRPFRLLYKPCRAGKAICICGMIVVIVRQREVGDGQWLVSDFSQLALQCLVYGRSRFRCASGLNKLIGDDSGLPEERSSR